MAYVFMASRMGGAGFTAVVTAVPQTASAQSLALATDATGTSVNTMGSAMAKVIAQARGSTSPFVRFPGPMPGCRY
jgi:hypothetical protein